MRTTLLVFSNFDNLDQGAKGRIVEDCFFCILRSTAIVRFPFTQIPPDGTNPQPNSVSLRNEGTEVVDVRGGDEEVLPSDSINWPATPYVFVFIPLHRQYKGIDFIIARKTGKTLYVYFVQCTVQNPKDHPIVDSDRVG